MDSKVDRKHASARGLKIAFGLSLMVNLVVIGAIAGAMMGGGAGRDGRAHTDRTLGLGPMGRALSQEDRRAMLQIVEEDPGALLAERRQIMRATRAFLVAVEADPFDRMAAETALSAQRGHVTGIQERGHAVLLQRLENMSQAEREGFAQRLRRRLGRRHSRRDH